MPFEDSLVIGGDEIGTGITLHPTASQFRTIYNNNEFTSDGGNISYKTLVGKNTDYVLPISKLDFGNFTVTALLRDRIVIANNFNVYIEVYVLIDPVTFKSSPTGDEHLMTGGATSTPFTYFINYPLDDIYTIAGMPVHWSYDDDDIIYFIIRPVGETASFDYGISITNLSADEVGNLTASAGQDISYNSALIPVPDESAIGIQFIPYLQ